MNVQPKNFIAGKWHDPAGKERTRDLSPATGEVLAEIPHSTPEEAKKAIAAASEAFQTWRLVPAPKRGEILHRIAKLLEREKEEFAQLLTREMGKVIAEARGDIQEAIDMAYYMAGEGRRQFGQTVPSELREKFMMTIRQPMGVVSVITPWNFPVAVPSWKIMPALVLGNCVVWKPSMDTPLCAIRYVQILEEAGVPSGVMNLVLGAGPEMGEILYADPAVSCVSFTGSTAVGKTINAGAAPHLKRVSLEMGGKNAILVLADADLDLAVDGILWSAFGTTGQRCTAASRLIVEKSVAETLAGKLVERMRTLKVGNGLDPKVEVGPLINRAALEKVDTYVRIGREEDGAKLAEGGEPAVGGDLFKGFFYKPTLFTGVTPQMRIAREEIFGPVLSMIEVADFEEGVRTVNDTRYGLSSSIYTRDVNKAFRAMRDFETGLMYVNAGTIGSEVSTPFGGWKETGNGHREAGEAALDVFSEWKSVFVDYSGRLQKAQIDTAS